MNKKQDLSDMSPCDIIKRVSLHVYEAALSRAFGLDDSKDDKACRELHRHCAAIGRPYLYDRGWELGVKDIRP